MNWLFVDCDNISFAMCASAILYHMDMSWGTCPLYCIIWTCPEVRVRSTVSYGQWPCPEVRVRSTVSYGHVLRCVSALLYHMDMSWGTCPLYCIIWTCRGVRVRSTVSYGHVVGYVTALLYHMNVSWGDRPAVSYGRFLGCPSCCIICLCLGVSARSTGRL